MLVGNCSKPEMFGYEEQTAWAFEKVWLAMAYKMHAAFGDAALSL